MCVCVGGGIYLDRFLVSERDGCQLHRLVVISLGKVPRYRWVDVCAGPRGSLLRALQKGESLLLWKSKPYFQVVQPVVESRVLKLFNSCCCCFVVDDNDDDDKGSELYSVVYDNVTLTELKKNFNKRNGQHFSMADNVPYFEYYFSVV